jgi:predicted NUDIX family NTP pyrophosphohydrolase
MAKRSAGLLMYRMRGGLELLLAHPGGPFWRGKDLGAWTIPKGEYDEDEDPLTAARREFREEMGWEPAGEFAPLTPLKQPSGKVISAWAIEGDWNPGLLVSNTFSLEWPRGSGVSRDFPEIDRAAWFDAAEARRRIIAGQAGFIDELERQLGAGRTALGSGL